MAPVSAFQTPGNLVSHLDVSQPGRSSTDPSRSSPLPSCPYLALSPPANKPSPLSHREIRGNYDYAHSVFPLYQWRHSVGAFQITPHKNASSPYLQASTFWKWRVDWKANTTGVVSTGTYNDVFEKRGDEWKVLTRVSRDDPNWPLYIFAPYADNAASLFRSGCGDTSL